MIRAVLSETTDVITQSELDEIAARQTALFEATRSLSEDLNRIADRLAAGAVVEPGKFVFDSGRVLVCKRDLSTGTGGTH